MNQNTKARKEFEKKFNHFNDLYLGHKRNEKNPEAGKQICSWDCERVYDLDDVWKFFEKKLTEADKNGYERGRKDERSLGEKAIPVPTHKQSDGTKILDFDLHDEMIRIWKHNLKELSKAKNK